MAFRPLPTRTRPDGDASGPADHPGRGSRRRPLAVVAIAVAAVVATPLLVDGDEPAAEQAVATTETTVALERIAFTAKNALAVPERRRVRTTSSPGMALPAPTTTTPPTTTPPTTAPPTTAPPTTAAPTTTTAPPPPTAPPTTAAPTTTAPPPTAPPRTAPPTTAPPTTAPPTTAPPTTAPPTTAPPTTAAPAAPSSSGSGVWDRLAQCEAGGNWAINTGNGYYGGLQFSAGSWQAMGGSGLPHQASRATQIAMGERLLAAQGWGAWPSCSSKLGLR